jgi:putative hydrolase of the HAD superfamily
MIRRVKAVLFDLDETLVDRTASLLGFLRGQHRRFADRMGSVTADAYCRRFLELDALYPRAKSRLYATRAHDLAIAAPAGELLADLRHRFATSCRLFPDAEWLLQALRSRGYRLGIVTNGSVRLQGGKIAHLGLASLVDTILISEREKARKPDPTIFHRAAGRLGVAPAACLFVGDDPAADVAGALAAGMGAVWRRDRPWPEDLPIAPPRTIAALSELLELLGMRA